MERKNELRGPGEAEKTGSVQEERTRRRAPAATLARLLAALAIAFKLGEDLEKEI
jgi:hypothetical protein